MLHLAEQRSIVDNAVIAEVTGKAGFDSVTIDLQHGLNDYQVALAMLQALAASDSTPMARVPWLEPGIIMKLLDAGALGIICPMVNTRADAERLVHYAKYAPAGTRSFGPTRAMLVHAPTMSPKRTTPWSPSRWSRPPRRWRTWKRSRRPRA